MTYEFTTKVGPRVQRLLFAARLFFWRTVRWHFLGILRGAPRRSRLRLQGIRKSLREKNQYTKIPAREVFWTTAILPNRMFGNTEEAIRLQLNQLSPIQPGEAMFSVGRRPRRLLGSNTAKVALAIVRKKTMNDLNSNATVAMEGSQHTYFLSEDFGQQLLKRGVRSKLVLGFFFCFALILGVFIYSNRLNAGYAEYQQSLTTEIRMLRIDIEGLVSIGADYPAISSSAMTDFLRAHENSGDVVVLNMELTPTLHQATGFVDQATAIPSNVTSSALSAATNRGSYRQLQLRANVDGE